MMRKLTGWLLALGICAPALAEDPQAQRQFGPWIYGISGGAVQQLSTDLNGTEGSFSVTRWFVQPSIGYAWNRQTTVSLSLGAGESSYKFSQGSQIDGQGPWDRIRDYRLSLPIRFAPSHSSQVIVIPSIRTYAEAGADLADGRSEGVLAGISWRLNESLVLGPGFGWFTQPGDSPNVFPIVVIDWNITPRLKLATGRGLAASQGPGLTISYSLGEHWQLGLTGRYEKVRFAVQGADEEAEGFGQDRSFPLLFTMQYSPWPMTSVNVLLGAEFNGELRLENDRGEAIADVEYNTAPVIGFSFSSRF